MVHADAPARATVAARPTASRKLLARKAAERSGDAAPAGYALENIFPGAGATETDDAGDNTIVSKTGSAAAQIVGPSDLQPAAPPSVKTPESGASEPAAPAPAPQAASAPA